MKKLILSAILLLCMSVTPMAQAQVQANAIGSIRGATLYFLDGSGQPPRYIIANQDDPDVAAKLCNIFARYHLAGVNWVRFLVVAHQFKNQPEFADIYTNPYPVIEKVNQFMEQAQVCGVDLTFELLLDPRQQRQWFTDPPPYTNDLNWYRAWLDNLDMTHVGMIMLTGDTSPCAWNGTVFQCYGDNSLDVTPLAYNNGHWVASVYPILSAEYPDVLMGVDMMAGDQAGNNELLKKTAEWVDAFIPTAPYTALSLHFALPVGSTWQDYAAQDLRILSNYHSVTNRDLWMDEIGGPMCNPSGCGTPETTDDYTWADQSAAINGWLAVLACQQTTDYPVMLWAAHRDYGMVPSYGMISNFTGNVPNFKSVWNTVSLYYNLQVCP